MTAAIVLGFVYFASDDHGSLGGTAAETLAVYGTVALGVVVLLIAVAYLVRPSPGLAATYSWLALAVLVLNASLVISDYWRQARVYHGPPYDMVPALLTVSAIALVPAVIGQIVYSVRGIGRWIADR